MNVIVAYPPNIEAIHKAFPVTRVKKGVVYTYGKFIFNPDNGPIDEALKYHEATHSLQQDELGPDLWWKKYIDDPQFRLDQEIEAYQNQYHKYCDMTKDRNKRARLLMRVAIDLASPQYGSIISMHDARQRIQNYKS